MEKTRKRQRNVRKRKQKQQHALQRKQRRQRRQERPKPSPPPAPPKPPPPAVAAHPLMPYLRPGWPPSANRSWELAELRSELQEVREALLARGARTADEPHFVGDLVEWRRLVVEDALAHQAQLRADLRVKVGDFVEFDDHRFLVSSTPSDEDRIVFVQRKTATGFRSIPADATGLEPYMGPLTPEELLQREALLTRPREPARRPLFGTPEAVLDQARALVELDAAQPAFTQTQRLAALACPELTILCSADTDAPAPLSEALPAATLGAARAARVAVKTMRAAAWYDWVTKETWLDIREDSRWSSCSGDDESLKVASAARRREWLLASAAILTLRELSLALALARERDHEGPPLRLRAQVRRAELRLSRARAQCRSAPDDRATPGLLCGPALVAIGSRRERAVLATIAKLAGT